MMYLFFNHHMINFEMFSSSLTDLQLEWKAEEMEREPNKESRILFFDISLQIRCMIYLTFHILLYH